MKRSILIPLLLLCLALAACNQSRPKTLADVSEQLTQQFRNQWNSVSHTSPRELKSVRARHFTSPNGTSSPPYLGIDLVWNDVVTSTGVPMIPLGDGLFGVTYQDSQTKEELSAVISFR